MSTDLIPKNWTVLVENFLVMLWLANEEIYDEEVAIFGSADSLFSEAGG